MIVGLTGGIGSGKSTVAEIFKSIGIPVYDADQNSKQLIDEEPLQTKLVGLLGKEVLTAGLIDRPKMASLIFNNEQLLTQANALIHPSVGAHFDQWVQSQSRSYVLKEAAILFESGSYEQCDKVIVVTAPDEMRIKRVMKRNGISRDEVMARMKNQWPESEKVKRADYVIKNDLSKSLIKQVLKVHEDIIGQAN